MKFFKENEMIKGWFVGNFEPTCFNVEGAEVALKRYKKGDIERSHHHKMAYEITFVVSGKISMNGLECSEGQIILVEPGESVSFESIDDSINVVVKVPCVKGDKYED